MDIEINIDSREIRMALFGDQIVPVGEGDSCTNLNRYGMVYASRQGILLVVYYQNIALEEIYFGDIEELDGVHYMEEGDVLINII